MVPVLSQVHAYWHGIRCRFRFVAREHERWCHLFETRWAPALISFKCVRLTSQ
eukprot:SAG11_NODE_1518_length_4761_cov_2.905405_10_plen_53_part_00